MVKEHALGFGQPDCTLKKGDKVSFTATFEQSNNDKLFGFWKRPTKWSVAGQPINGDEQLEAKV